jgi:uncharacterized protein (TIGR03083 family)
VTALDHAGEYRQLRTRVVGLVRSCDAATLESTPPATPEWRIRDVLAHLSGVCADIVNGNLDGVTTDPWTAAQVDTRRDWTVDRLLEEWEEQGTKVEGVIRSVPHLPDWNTFLFDAATHEQDIRGALGLPGGREAPALVIGVEWGLEMIGMRYDADGKGRLRVEHEGGVSEAGTTDPVTTVRTTRFELGRAMTGRRSVAQMKAYDWDGPRPQEDLLLADFFTPPATDLVE